MPMSWASVRRNKRKTNSSLTLFSNIKTLLFLCEKERFVCFLWDTTALPKIGVVIPLRSVYIHLVSCSLQSRTCANLKFWLSEAKITERQQRTYERSGPELCWSNPFRCVADFVASAVTKRPNITQTFPIVFDIRL